MNSRSTSWWSLLLINRPREDERLSWPCWLTYSGRFTHINGQPSAAGPVQTSESLPVRDRRSTTEPPNAVVHYIITSCNNVPHMYRRCVLQACPSGLRTDINSICQKCVGKLTFYDWMYLAFMAVVCLGLHWFFVDLTYKRNKWELL